MRIQVYLRDDVFDFYNKQNRMNSNSINQMIDDHYQYINFKNTVDMIYDLVTEISENKNISKDDAKKYIRQIDYYIKELELDLQTYKGFKQPIKKVINVDKKLTKEFKPKDFSILLNNFSEVN